MAKATVFEDARLITGRRAEVLGPVDVVVEGDVITEVRAHRTTSPAGADRIDCNGMTVMPGLIDCHVHYTLDPDSDPPLAWGRPRTAVLVGAYNARRALLSGVTTARSAGARANLDIALRDGIDAGRIPGPRILAAGQVVGITGGHGYQFGHEGDSEVELIRAVRRQVRAGADVIKVMASEAAMLTTTGLSSRHMVHGSPELSERELKAIVTAASAAHCRTFSHAHDNASVIASSEAGVASVEHAFLADEEAIRMLKENNTTLVPTLTVTDVNRGRTDITEVQRRRQSEIERSHRRSCELAISMDVPIATGTDCGEPGVWSNMLWREVALLQEHGMSPLDAIFAATGAAAGLIGVDEVGAVEVGKAADLIAVRGDPLTDLSRLSAPCLVMKGGQMARREERSDG